jgi:hypothetical protein
VVARVASTYSICKRTHDVGAPCPSLQPASDDSNFRRT